MGFDALPEGQLCDCVTTTAANDKLHQVLGVPA